MYMYVARKDLNEAFEPANLRSSASSTGPTGVHMEVWEIYNQS